MRRIIAILSGLLAVSAAADVVHVYERTLAGGVAAQIADRTLDTGRSYFTQSAPKKNGWIFTHWTISTQQTFSTRDAWGRAFDSAEFKLYEETTLTANYLPASQDDDGDGIADGYEIYWYGNLANGSSSDTDNDGKTFAQEIEAVTNPLFPECHEEDPVKYADTAEHEMNLQPYGQVQGAVVGGAYLQVFTSPVAGNAAASAAIAPYQLCDVDGDGEVTELDLRLLAKLKSAAGRKYAADQLKAGDSNGNGKLDNADYQALREVLKEKGLLAGNG